MQRPDWVFFDYGETLVHEEPFDHRRGSAKLLECAVENPRGLTVDDVCAVMLDITGYSKPVKYEMDIEVHSMDILRLASQLLGLRFHMPWEELDEAYWEAAAPGVAMPGADELLAYLEGADIKTAIISNMGFTSNQLKHRLDKLLPGHEFAFIMTSSEYFFRKPGAMLFQAALARAGAKTPWHVGDNVRCDIGGASAAGIFPVWVRHPGFARTPDQPHAAVDGLRELIAMIENCETKDR